MRTINHELIRNNILQMLAYMKLKASEVEKQIGVAQGYISHVCSDTKQQNVGEKTAKQLAYIFGLEFFEMNEMIDKKLLGRTSDKDVAFVNNLLVASKRGKLKWYDFEVYRTTKQKDKYSAIFTDVPNDGSIVDAKDLNQSERFIEQFKSIQDMAPTTQYRIEGVRCLINATDEVLLFRYYDSINNLAFAFEVYCVINGVLIPNFVVRKFDEDLFETSEALWNNIKLEEPRKQIEKLYAKVSEMVEYDDNVVRIVNV